MNRGTRASRRLSVIELRALIREEARKAAGPEHAAARLAESRLRHVVRATVRRLVETPQVYVLDRVWLSSREDFVGETEYCVVVALKDPTSKVQHNLQGGYRPEAEARAIKARLRPGMKVTDAQMHRLLG